MALLRWLACSTALTASFATAQFPPTPEGVTTKEVLSHPGVSVSYKGTCICETKAKAWAGYVNMPSSYLSDIEGSDPYNISMFFWYFEARKTPETAPTAIYLAGGPGESSLFGATQDGGPCNVGIDSNSTYLNTWSWNDKVNMLYVDQPVGAGYSYDSLIKSTLDLLLASATGTGIVAFDEYKGDVPAMNTTFLHGILPSQNANHTANTTGIAAVTLWHFSQIWFTEFPEWTTSNKHVSIWGNSYGGYWVPASGAYFQKQNSKINHGEITGTVIELDQIGITNGCIDMLYEIEWYPQMAYNNTYGFQAINKTVYELGLDLFSKPGGCRDRIVKCRELAAVYDTDDLAINATVNGLCNKAVTTCVPLVGIFQSDYSLGHNRSAFDMARLLPDPFPLYSTGFFNQDWVQKALGVPVNFTSDSLLINDDILFTSGDPMRRAGMKDVEYLLNSGVKVTLIYGDRDQRCPWLGVEQLSLAANWSGADSFRAAGYSMVHTNDSYNGGVVRQHGNLSFSRVFEAGHDVAAYQPETVYEIFNRAMFDQDVATGKISTAGSSNVYSTSGPSSSYGWKNKLSTLHEINCQLWTVASTCTEDQYKALRHGTAEIVDYNVVKPAGGGGPIIGGSSSF